MKCGWLGSTAVLLASGFKVTPCRPLPTHGEADSPRTPVIPSIERRMAPFGPGHLMRASAASAAANGAHSRPKTGYRQTEVRSLTGTSKEISLLAHQSVS